MPDFFAQFAASPTSASQPTPSMLPAPVAPITVKNETSWFAFEAEEEKPKPVATPSTSVQPASPPKSGPVFYLAERWEGAYEGSKCTKSVAVGEVGLRKHIWKQASGKEVKFRLRSSEQLSEPSRSRCDLKRHRSRMTITHCIQGCCLLHKICPTSHPPHDDHRGRHLHRETEAIDCSLSRVQVSPSAVARGDVLKVACLGCYPECMIFLSTCV